MSMFIEGDVNFSFDDPEYIINELTYTSSPTNLSADGYYQGFEYRIVPLVTNLSQRGNDSEMTVHNDELYCDDINVFDTVVGKAFKDLKKHTGVVIQITYKDDNLTPKYIWILDNETREKFALLPKSCRVCKEQKYISKKKLNIFDTNSMHLHEGYDIFSDDNLKYDDSLKDLVYKITCNRKFSNSKSELEDIDELLERDGHINIGSVINVQIFKSLLGIDKGSIIILEKYFRMFLKKYCILTGHYYDKKSKILFKKYSNNMSSNVVDIQSWYSPDEDNKLRVCSWKDVYMMYVAFMYVYNYVRHTDDFKMKGTSYIELEVRANPKSEEFIKKLGSFLTSFIL